MSTMTITIERTPRTLQFGDTSLCDDAVWPLESQNHIW